MYNQKYKYKNVKTNIVSDHSQLPTSCIPLDEHFDFLYLPVSTLELCSLNPVPGATTYHFCVLFQSIFLLVTCGRGVINTSKLYRRYTFVDNTSLY